MSETITQYIIVRAIEEGCSVYVYDDLPLNRDIARVIDVKTSDLLEIVDANAAAKELGDIKTSNRMLEKILGDDTLRLLSAYLLQTTLLPERCFAELLEILPLVRERGGANH